MWRWFVHGCDHGKCDSINEIFSEDDMDLGTPLNYNDHVSIQLGVLIVDWTLIINVLLGMS